MDPQPNLNLNLSETLQYAQRLVTASSIIVAFKQNFTWKATRRLYLEILKPLANNLEMTKNIKIARDKYVCKFTGSQYITPKWKVALLPLYETFIYIPPCVSHHDAAVSVYFEDSSWINNAYWKFGRGILALVFQALCRRHLIKTLVREWQLTYKVEQHFGKIFGVGIAIQGKLEPTILIQKIIQALREIPSYIQTLPDDTLRQYLRRSTRAKDALLERTVNVIRRALHDMSLSIFAREPCMQVEL